MICPLCEREIINGTEHHLIPKCKKGKEKVLLHKICHDQIHCLFPEKLLAKKYSTIEALLSDERIVKFIEWVKTKPLDFYCKMKKSR